jgi:hypothetical protein
MNIPSWISTDSAVWLVFFGWLSTALLSAVRSDNPAIPIEFSTRGKLILVTVLGVLQAFFQTKVQPGTTWLQAILTAIMSQGGALGGHGFRNTISMPPAGGVLTPATESAPAMVVPTVPAPPASLRRFIPESALARMTLAAGVVLCGFMMLCAFLSSGCTPAQGAADVLLIECIVGTYADDLRAGETPIQAGEDTARQCATDLPTVLQTLSDVKKAKAMRATLIVDAGFDH